MSLFSTIWRARATLLLLACIAGVLTASYASPAAAAETTINREILGLYNGVEEGLAEETRLHQRLEMPLNHLGYKLTLHDVSTGLPAAADVKKFHAVATWFSGPIPNASSYLTWAASVAKSGTKFVILDSIGADAVTAKIPQLNSFLNQIGLSIADYYVSDTRATQILTYDAAMIDFEHILNPAALPGYQVITATSADVKRHLSVADPVHKWAKATDAVLVASGPRGAYVSPSYSVHFDIGKSTVRWAINPFAFLEAALKPRAWPIPDTTTVSGRRLYFSHIDGDGWNNITQVEPYAQERAIAGEVVLDALIAPYPDLPVSVGLIAGDADEAMGAKPAAAGVASAIFALPNVETASHTYTHPYFWDYFATYNRAKEVQDVLRFSGQPAGYDDPSLTALVADWRNGGEADFATPTALTTSAAPPPLPRAKPHFPFDLTAEVQGAITFTNTIAPSDKPAKVYLWSGNTRPFAAAVKATRTAGVRNLNGGDSRFDSSHPSVAYLAPLSRTVGSERQIYAVNSNENTYTDGWSPPFDGFKKLAETLDNTETPQRLKGFNVYYHAFSATQTAGVDAIISHLERARKSEIAPITASHYAGIADGFFSARIIALAPIRWRITERGLLDTLRFDDAAQIDVDYTASSGVTGHRRHAGSLYISLDADVATPVIAVHNAARISKQPAALTRAHLVHSRWRISSVKIAACEVSASATGFGTGEMTWGGLKPGTYKITAVQQGATVASITGTATAAGELSVQIDASAIDPLAIKIQCLRG